MTLRCCVCHEKFTPAATRLYPDLPGYCDKCAALEEETRPGDPLEEKIRDLKIGESFFLPVTPQDPHPWETAKTEIGRTRWAFLSGGLCVHRVQEGNLFIDNNEQIDFETGDGARVFKSLTFEDLSLGIEFVSKLVAEQAHSKGPVSEIHGTEKNIGRVA